jgi:TolC family type I secretion outer membrane protein
VPDPKKEERMFTDRCGGRIIASALAAGAVALVSIAPAPVMADRLSEALVAAYLGNPDLDAERARLRATDELVPQALSGWRPQVFIDSSYQLLRGQNTQGDLDANTTANALSVRQNLYAGGGTKAQTSRAENLVKAGRAGLIAAEQSVLLSAVNAYTSAWRDLAVLDLALSNERVLRRQLQQTRDQFDVGEVARTDVAQAEAGVSRAQSDVEQAKANLAASNASYKQVVGREPRQLADPIKLTDLPATLEETQAIAESNPNIIAATHQLFAARDDVDVAFANLLPSLDVVGDVGYQDEPRNGINYQRSASIGVALSVPLYQGGAEYSRVRQNRETVQQQRSTLESTNRAVQANATTTWEQLQAAAAAVQSFRDEVRANQVAFEGVNQEQLVGLRTVIDVLDAQQDLFTSQVNLVRARAVEVVASYQLRAATGRLTVQDLGLPVAPYEPEAYFIRNRNRLFGLDGTG